MMWTIYSGYGGSNPVYVPDTLSIETLLRLQKSAMRRFYFRPRFVWGEMMLFRRAKIKAYLSGLKGLI